MSSKEQTILKGILNNERCNICTKKTNIKCLQCLFNNTIAGYCLHHHEPMHKPIWISEIQ